MKDIDELRARILTAWDEMDQRIIDAAIRQWCTRFRTCIKAKCGHFEHTSSQCLTHNVAQPYTAYFLLRQMMSKRAND